MAVAVLLLVRANAFNTAAGSVARAGFWVVLAPPTSAAGLGSPRGVFRQKDAPKKPTGFALGGLN